MASSIPSTAGGQPGDGDSLRAQRSVELGWCPVDGPQDRIDVSAQHKSSVFTNRNFLLLWSGNAISLIGFNGVCIAYPLLALMLTGSPVLAGCVSFVMMAPSVLFQVSAGIAADYWDRRRILVLCQWTGLAATLLTTVAVALRPPGVWLLLLVVAAFIGATAIVSASTSLTRPC